ncbi:MAG: DUF962 domain-containing protein [Candidatus Omnitrophica bacterium]|nr:DUF962 domain-containing protein [Candidatus Omnitrophota bacterium]
MVKALVKYVRNYRSRHANNLNVIIHIIGISECIFGLMQLLMGRWKWGLFNIFMGFFLQWIGHTYIEKNEMGEIAGIKKMISKFRDI